MASGHDVVTDKPLEYILLMQKAIRAEKPSPNSISYALKAQGYL